jgi:uncharacterized protein
MNNLIPAAPLRSLPVESPPAVSPIVGGRVELQLLTTLKCNLKCSYCSLGVGEVLGSQTELKYDIDQLAAFVDTHLAGKEVYVTFYGGEPTLNRDMMDEVMRRFPQFRYQLQTNGTLLDSLPDWMLHRLSNILVSIDGGERTTDGYRGRGVWRQVLKQRGARARPPGRQLHRARDLGPSRHLLRGTRRPRGILRLPVLAVRRRRAVFRDDSVDKRKAVLVQLIDKFFAAPTSSTR